ncbi:cation diffusion facilitator family transporter [Enterovirga aerilata]|uniref:Cation transporter n=1 Tax=Enterovirga aerilata TaxID=2730920 RepID=A0A849I9E7_9HYPH|nr:cation diffusion facilitator family transporter [Enterovirga sp. DB1703]NNM73931.1 cation transporter [Enterovirga sp. DB1703]
MSGEHSRGGLTRSAASQNRKGLAWALALTLTYMAAEVVGGLLTGSLALLADAAHMLTDAGGLAFALLAIRLGERPPTPERTYGLLRAEILTALGNAVVLLLLTIYILFEAYERFRNPPEVLGPPMLAVAAVGLAVNLVSMRLLSTGSGESLNVRGAYFEVLSDMLGSLGVIVAALIVTFTGWRLADPLVGAGIGLFIVPRTWSLLREATHVLLEATPARIDLRALDQRLRSIPGVVATHHLHVWTITSGLDAMSAHLVVSEASSGGRVLAQARQLVAEEFGIGHVTIQVEDANSPEAEAALPV